MLVPSGSRRAATAASRRRSRASAAASRVLGAWALSHGPLALGRVGLALVQAVGTVDAGRPGLGGEDPGVEGVGGRHVQQAQVLVQGGARQALVHRGAGHQEVEVVGKHQAARRGLVVVEVAGPGGVAVEDQLMQAAVPQDQGELAVEPAQGRGALVATGAQGALGGVRGGREAGPGEAAAGVGVDEDAALALGPAPEAEGPSWQTGSSPCRAAQAARPSAPGAVGIETADEAPLPGAWR